MNKTIILITSFVTVQTMPMGWLMSKTNQVGAKIALLSRIPLVKPATLQKRPYFSKSINYLKSIEQEHSEYINQCKQNGEARSIKIFLASYIQNRFITKPRKELEDLNNTFNQKRALLLECDRNERLKRKALADDTQKVYEKILHKKKKINSSLNNSFLQIEYKGRRLKLPEE